MATHLISVQLEDSALPRFNGPITRPTVHQVVAATSFVRLAAAEYAVRICNAPPAQVSEEEKRSYVEQLDQLWSAAQETEKNIIMYHALFGDELSTVKLVAVILITKEQKKLLANSDFPQYIISIQGIRKLIIELRNVMDCFISALALTRDCSLGRAELSSRAGDPQSSVTALQPSLVPLPFPFLQRSAALPANQPVVGSIKESKSSDNISPPSPSNNHSKTNPIFPQQNRTCSTRFQRRGVIGTVIFSLMLLCCAYISFVPVDSESRFTGVGFEHLRSHCVSIPPITASEFHERQNNLARILYSSNASAYIAEPGANALYFGNISDTMWHLSERPLLLIISPTQTSNGDVTANVTIVTPKFEATRARRLSVPAPHVNYLEWAEEENPYQAAISAISGLEQGSNTIYLSDYSRLFISDGIKAAAPTAKVVSAPLQVRSLRERKSEAEIALLRCVNEVTLLAIRAVREKMHVGISDSTTQKLVIDALTSAGLESLNTIVLFGEDAALPHGGGTGRILRKEDLILLDVGGTLHGYYSDVTRTFALSESNIPQNHLKIWHSVAAAQSSALATATKGATTHRVDDVARGILTQAGYGRYFTHRLGHGIGLEGHEAPYLRGGNKGIIQIGHTFSDEPGVYIEGKVGIRLEDCFVVTKNGTSEYLTKGVGGAARNPWLP